MTLKIEASSYFDKFLDMLNFEIQVKDDICISEVLDILKLPKDHVGFVVVNSSKVSVDYKLKDNDTIAIFPYLIGG